MRELLRYLAAIAPEGSEAGSKASIQRLPRPAMTDVQVLYLVTPLWGIGFVIVIGARGIAHAIRESRIVVNNHFHDGMNVSGESDDHQR